MATLQPVASASCVTADARIKWFGPTNVRDRRPLESWCESVGRPVIVTPSPTGNDDLAQTGLVVVTWNVHEGAGRIDRFLEGIGRSNVILLVQEAMRSSDEVPLRIPAGVDTPRREQSVDASNIGDIAQRLGMWAVYVPSMRNGTVREDRGCAILSTLPLTDPIAIELPWVHQRRVVVGATVRAKVGEKPIAMAVLSAHLDNRPGRKIQSAALAEWLKVRLKPDATTEVRLKPDTTSEVASGFSRTIIIGGDLNAWFGKREDTVRQIDDVVPRVKDCEGGPTARLGRRLDFLFASQLPAAEHSCEVLRSTFGSDHHPVVLTLNFER